MWPTDERPESGIFVADQAAALRRLGVELQVFSFEGGSAISYIRAAWKLARRRDTTYDVVHAHFGLSAWVSLAAKARIRAVTFHGTDLEHPRSRKLSAAVLRFIDLPCAVSDALASRIPTRHLRHKPQVLPCGVALDRFKQIDRAEAREQLGLDGDARLFLLPSDPSRPEKRADRARDLAAKAYAQLLTLGGVAPQEVSLLINAADLVVIPSEREGFGLALLESLACGTPVMSTPNGIAPTALSNMEGALCADWDLAIWAEAATRLLAGGRLVDGRGRVEQWSSDTCARHVLDAWNAALGASSEARTEHSGETG